ncbi:MAG: hypothetical protein EXR45_04030 [Chloroflexi bacterium]|nr:hypothetical protein [Chloroflexota bacterium]
MSRRIGLVLAALVLGFILALVFFPNFRETIRRTPPNRGGTGKTNPVLIGAMGYLGYVNDGDAYVIDIAQGSTTRVTRSGGVSRPRVAPGGQFAAFDRNGALFIAHTDGSAEYQLPNGTRPETARWSYYNVALVYTTADGALMTFDPRIGERGSRQFDAPGSGVGSTAAWAANGTKIAFERRRPVRDGYSREGIWVVDTVSRNPVAMPVYLATGVTGLRLCCWTGNDQYILFWQVPLSEDAPGATARLLIAEASSSEPVELSASSLMLRGLVGAGGTGAVTPFIDGGDKPWTNRKRLLVTEPTAAPNGQSQVKRVVLEASEQLSPGMPSLPLTGTTMAYSVGPSLGVAGNDVAKTLANRRIWVVGFDGKQKRSLLPAATVPQGVSDDQPEWARDAKTIVFARRLGTGPANLAGARGGRLEVWVAYADGSNARRLVGGLDDPGVNDLGLVDYDLVYDFQP